VTAPGDHRRWRSELAAYMLGGLEPGEAEALERHLEGCERCRNELRWLQPAIDVLPESLPQLEPPAALRERLMAQVRREAALAAAGAADRREQAAALRPWPRLRRFFLRPAVALTAISLIAAVAAGYAIRGGGGRTTTIGAEGRATSTTAAHGGHAIEATLKRSGDSGTLELTGMRQLGPSRVYQAWVQRNDRFEPYGVFEARRDGSASTVIPHHLNGAQMVLVTVEPRGGSSQPTSSPIVSVPVRG
jgi:anti-sigma-K factor RskA